MSTHAERNRVPLLLWPFWAIWQLFRFIVELTGRIIAITLGFVLMVVGVILSATVIGAVIGLPLAAIGLLLVIAGLF